MEKLDNIYDLLHVIFDVLPDEYNEKVVSCVCPGDTIKITKDGSTNALYMGFDYDYPSVVEATVWDESDPSDTYPFEEGIYWDTDDKNITPESIGQDIQSYL